MATGRPGKLGASNAFKAKVPTVTVTLTFIDEGAPIANTVCTVHAPHPQKEATDANGELVLTVPASAKVVAVEFPSLGVTKTLGIGHLDPVECSSGILQRLANLGYVAYGEDGLADTIAVVDPALNYFSERDGS